MGRWSRLSIGVVVCWCLVGLTSVTGGAVPAVEPPHPADIRRVLTLLSVVAEEYRVGVVDGVVVVPVEYEEAKLFLDEAETRLGGVANLDASQFANAFAAIRTGLADRLPLDDVRHDISRLRRQIATVTGVTEEVFPSAPPSPARGRLLYMENCIACHGEQANGKGQYAAALEPAPADFTDPNVMRIETPIDFFSIIGVGKRTSAMPAWGDVLSLQDRWDLVSYLWGISPGPSRRAEGQGIYLTNCVGCHGVTGDGQGPLSAGLLKPVPELDRLSSLVHKADTDLFTVVADGVPGTPMTGFSRILSEDDIWAVVAYTRLLSLGADESMPSEADWDGRAPRRFAGLLRLVAAQYQDASAAESNAQVDSTESEILLKQALRNSKPVLTKLAEREPTTAHGLRGQLVEMADAIQSGQPAERVTELAAAAARRIEIHFPDATVPSDTRGAAELTEARDLLGAALVAYEDGNPHAVYLVSDAYFRFEPLEKQLSVLAPELTDRIEANFLALRGLLGTRGTFEDASVLVQTIDTDLVAARTVLAPRPNAYVLAVQSGTIILREGFEVILIIGALLAYVVRSGAPHMKRPILWGMGVGIILSLVTAYAFVQLFHFSGAAVEVLEGVAMLLASAVLFFVSYWMISKAEAEKWQQYVQGKMKTALARGSSLALGGAAFLAVYREGVETTLFYQALVASAVGSISPIVGGFVAGGVGLAVLAVLFVRFGIRIPLRQFFLGTSVLLYYLAFVFAGKGVAALQQAGWVGVTPAAGAPQIGFLGIYPTIETLGVQALLFACLLYAVIITVRRWLARRPRTDSLLGEVTQLRSLAAEIRAELRRLANRAPAGSESAGERLERLIAQVTQLENRMSREFQTNGGRKL